MSDRGIPANYRQMHGFGSHTFSFWNAKGERFWVKFHFKTEQGIANLTEEQAAKVKGIDPDHAQRDMVAAIQDGNFPSWKLKVQIMPEADANTYHINPFDLTKVWPHKDYPLIEVGVLELNRLPQNYFAEVEQVALAPSNLVPGVGASPDKMLQARLFAYADAQRYRIGANYNQLPVNCPHATQANHHQRAGAMAGLNALTMEARQVAMRRQTMVPTRSQAACRMRPSSKSRRCAWMVKPTDTAVMARMTTPSRQSLPLVAGRGKGQAYQQYLRYSESSDSGCAAANDWPL